MDDQNAAPATASPFLDPAKPILAAHPAITDDQRADLWDIFHQSKDSGELAQHLQPLGIPDELKHHLFVAKDATAPAPTPKVAPVDKVTGAIQRIAQMDPKVIDLAESHPNVLKTLATAAMQEEKTAGEPAGASKEPRSPKTPSGKTKAPAAVTDIPATPPAHALVRTRDGGLHHLPVENIEKARSIDKDLQVLHVEE
jgi:hypothetical protein